MRAVPIELPVSAREAGVLADIVFANTAAPNLAPARTRMAALIGAKKLSFTAYPGSLQRDPIHPTTFYMAVNELLLRLAPASSPSSGLFPNSLLIGRLRTAAGREVVVNAIPFSQSDHGTIRTYAEQVDREFLPRTGLQRRGMISTPPDAERVWDTAVWQAIHSGLRGGWSATLAVPPGCPETEWLDRAADFSRFSVGEQDAASVYEALQRARGRNPFELEVDLTGTLAATTPEEIRSILGDLRSQGIPAQFVAVSIGLDPKDSFDARLSSLHEAARPFNAVLSLDPGLRKHAAVIGRVTGGRVNYRVHDEPLQP